MESRPISFYLAPALLVLSAVLAAASWYLRPERPMAAAVAALVVGLMTIALLFAPRRATNASIPLTEGPSTALTASVARRETADSIRSGIVFAGLMIVCSLGAKLAAALGAVGDSGDLSRRATMAILGAFLVFTGNAIPKTLTPLAALQCDAARVQAFQRMAGWTWVLAGLALAVAWLALPLRLAETTSLVLLPGAMLIIGALLVRLWRARQRAA